MNDSVAAPEGGRAGGHRSVDLPETAPIIDGSVKVDVAIVGAGAAGLYAAACLPDDRSVLVIDKAAPGATSGSSPWAQGGIAAAVGADDSPAAHVADTLAASDGLADSDAAWALAREAPDHIDRLLRRGAAFDRDHDGLGRLAPAREGGQRFARSVRRGDASGAELMRVLRRWVAPKVQRLSGLVGQLVVNDGRVVGLWMLSDQRWVAVEAQAIILATGGCGGLFAATTNPVHANGDGLALAAGAGARLRDLEFVQFHPTALASGAGHRFLLTEALRGAGATLHDAQGERFLPSVHPDAELAPRHVVAGAILALDDGLAWLDATRLGAKTLRHEFPTVLAGVAEHGYDLATQRVPVGPAAHYHMGGVWTDLSGRTSRPGLYAAGEIACTGLHGANRMAGNSLSEALVFGARTAQQVAHDLTQTPADGTPWTLFPTTGPPETPTLTTAEVATTFDWLRSAMLRDAGPIRHGDTLAALHDALDTKHRQLSESATRPPSPVDVAEGSRGSQPARRTTGSDAGRQSDPLASATEVTGLRHALSAAGLIVRSALLRRESRGGHHRSDFPQADPLWAHVHLDVLVSSDDVASSRDAR